MDVFPGQNVAVTVRITPPNSILRGTYDVEILAISNSNSNVQQKDILRVYINTELPHLAADFGIPSELAPTSDKFNIILKNVGTTPLSDLKASLQSGLLPDADMNVNYINNGQASLIWDQFVEIPSNTKPGKYPVTLQILKDGVQVGELKKIVEILGQAKVNVDESITKGFLSETHDVFLENVGNIPATDSYTVEVPRWQKIFVQSTPKAYVMKAGKNTAELVWPYSLDLEQNARITYKISYVPLLAALIAALVLLYSLGWYYRQEFTISKEVYDEPGSKAMKVKITVKSRAPLVQDSVIVEDAVPTPLKLVKEFATVEPTLIRRQAGAMKVVWKFGKIYPGEERVLAYNLKTALPLIGSLVLPEARLKVRINNKAKQYLSNRVTVNARGVKVDETPAVED